MSFAKRRPSGEVCVSTLSACDVGWRKDPRSRTARELSELTAALESLKLAIEDCRASVAALGQQLGRPVDLEGDPAEALREAAEVADAASERLLKARRV